MPDTTLTSAELDELEAHAQYALAHGKDIHVWKVRRYLEILSLARAGLEADKAEEWLPIETAPKDGTEIILGSEPQMFNGQPVPARVTIGHWTTDEECRVDIGDCGGDCHCREYEYVDPSWISWDGGFTPENPPTHWRPPPAPPAIRALPLTGCKP